MGFRKAGEEGREWMGEGTEGRGNEVRELGREGGLIYIRETEKPKVSGCCVKSRLRSVDLPVPEGPETTIRGFPAGECSLFAGGTKTRRVRTQLKKDSLLPSFSIPLTKKLPPQRSFLLGQGREKEREREGGYVLAGVLIAALVLAEVLRNRRPGCGSILEEWDAVPGRRSSLSIRAAQSIG